MKNSKIIGRVGRYQSGNQNPYIEEKQTTQWPKGKVQKDQQRSTKHTNKPKIKQLSDYLSVTRTIMKTTKAVTMEAPIPVYSAVLLSSDFAETVRRNTCMCISQ